MDVATFAELFGNSQGVDYAGYLPGFQRACGLAGWNTVARVAMAAAQIGEESGGLRWSEELADGSEYNGRADLGNTQPGDGPRYKGRTFIQITGRHNYTALSVWASARRLVPAPGYFVDHPEQLAAPQYVWLGPVWYWTVARPNLNALADAHDIQGATRAVNGGLNGLDDRTRRWQHALGMGNRLMGGVPTPPPHTAPPAGHGVVANYTVQPGDTLTSIAHRYPQAWITPDSIARLNGISNPNLIRIGQVLRIG